MPVLTDDTLEQQQFPTGGVSDPTKLQVTQRMVSGSKLISDICMSLLVLPPVVMSCSLARYAAGQIAMQSQCPRLPLSAHLFGEGSSEPCVE
jgi:hypothetical protein